MNFLELVKSALADVSYKDWTFEVGQHPMGYWYWLRVSFNADNENWTGRKWPLSAHMTKSEIIQTALKAVLTAEEHEAREKFLYKSKAIFGPHLDVDALLGVHDRLDARATV